MEPVAPDPPTAASGGERDRGPYPYPPRRDDGAPPSTGELIARISRWIHGRSRDRLAPFGTTIFTEMTRLAEEHVLYRSFYLLRVPAGRVLALRVRSVLRRAPSTPSTVPLEFTVGDLSVSTAARSVTIAGEPVGLTNREFDLLLFFLTHTDTVFSREELLKRVWNWDFGDLSTVTVHVKRLRSKLGDHHRVQTVWGRGYLWQGDAGGGDRADA